MAEANRSVQHFFQVQKLTFRSIGIIFKSEEVIFIGNGSILFIFTSIYIYVTICILVFCLQNQDDYDLVTISIAITVALILGLCKLSVFLWKRSKIVDLIKNVESLLKNATAKELTIISEENLRDFRLSAKTVFCTFIGIAIGPFIPCVIQLIKTGQYCELNLPVNANFFVDIKNTFNYIIIYLLIMIAIYMDMGITLSMDTLFSWFVHNLCAKFRILCQNIQDIGATGLDENSNHAFGKFIFIHSQLLQLSDQLKEIYSTILFMQLALNALQLCFILVQIVKWSAVQFVPFFVTFFISAILQLTVYCYGGQRIQDESEAVSITLYIDSNWEVWSSKYKKNILLPLILGQKTIKIIGIFFVVNYELLLTVIKSAVSFTTIVMSFDNTRRD